jgi:hypothetical protein
VYQHRWLPARPGQQILFAPDTPRAGNELLITVSSAHPHPYGRLAGTGAA